MFREYPAEQGSVDEPAIPPGDISSHPPRIVTTPSHVSSRFGLARFARVRRFMAFSLPRDRVFLWLAAVGAAFVAAVALHQAMRWYDHPIGGMLVTPDLEVAAVGLPTWDGLTQGLAYPDRVLAADGVNLSGAKAR